MRARAAVLNTAFSKGIGDALDAYFADARQRIRDSVTVLSGLDKPFSRSGDGHYAKTANFLTGLHVRKTTGQDLNSGGVSVDRGIAIVNTDPEPGVLSTMMAPPSCATNRRTM